NTVNVDRRWGPIAEVAVGRQRVVADDKRSLGRLHDDNLHPGRVPADPFQLDTLDEVEGAVYDLQPAARLERSEVLGVAVAEKSPGPPVLSAEPMPEIHF